MGKKINAFGQQAFIEYHPEAQDVMADDADVELIFRKVFMLIFMRRDWNKKKWQSNTHVFHLKVRKQKRLLKPSWYSKIIWLCLLLVYY